MSRLHQLVREAQPEPAPASTPKAPPRPDPARRERPLLGEHRAFTTFFGCCGEAHEGFPRAPEKFCPGGHGQVNGQSGKTGELSGMLRLFRDHFLSPSGKPRHNFVYLSADLSRPYQFIVTP
jgi:hypothetical protein